MSCTPLLSLFPSFYHPSAAPPLPPPSLSRTFSLLCLLNFVLLLYSLPFLSHIIYSLQLVLSLSLSPDITIYLFPFSFKHFLSNSIRFSYSHTHSLSFSLLSLSSSSSPLTLSPFSLSYLSSLPLCPLSLSLSPSLVYPSLLLVILYSWTSVTPYKAYSLKAT